MAQRCLHREGSEPRNAAPTFHERSHSLARLAPWRFNLCGSVELEGFAREDGGPELLFDGIAVAAPAGGGDAQPIAGARGEGDLSRQPHRAVAAGERVFA